MTFVCSLDPTRDLEVDLLQREGEFIARTPIGYDSVTDATYAICAAMASVPGMVTLELIFYVYEADIDGNEITPHYDGKATKHFLSQAGEREQALDVICALVDALIDTADPSIVSMITHSDCLPDRALQKYHRVAAVFSRRGYHVGRADSYHGRHIWMMERVN